MIYPTIEDLTQGRFNRYELSIATAKCARIITAEYTKQREAAEKTINKESDRTVHSMVDADLCNEKSIKLAIERIYDGDFRIVEGKSQPVCQPYDNTVIGTTLFSELNDSIEPFDNSFGDDEVGDEGTDEVCFADVERAASDGDLMLDDDIELAFDSLDDDSDRNLEL